MSEQKKSKFYETYDTKLGDIQPRYLETKQAARYLGMGNAAKLGIWRRKGYGPPYIPTGSKGQERYMYAVEDLDQWMMDQKLYPTHNQVVNERPRAKPAVPKARPRQEKEPVIPAHLVFRNAVKADD